MKKTRWIMGMPITVSVIDKDGRKEDIDEVFSYFRFVDTIFSTYKQTSEISQINSGNVSEDAYSPQMKEIFALAEKTKNETHGFFDIHYRGVIDPSGIVKGWAIQNAARMLSDKGYRHYFVDAGGDIQTSGKNELGEMWRVGIRNPFDRNQIVKRIGLSGNAVATSGVYIRGQHIYNPYQPERTIDDIVSMTVVGPDIFDVDRFATAAFAMGSEGIAFIGSHEGFEGYMIDKDGVATYTSGFEMFVVPSNFNSQTIQQI